MRGEGGVVVAGRGQTSTVRRAGQWAVRLDVVEERLLLLLLQSHWSRNSREPLPSQMCTPFA